MSLREEIVTEIQNLPEDVLPELRETIKKLRERDEKPGLLRRLQKIKINGLPQDFSQNIDLYLSGEKDIDGNIR
jgi:hypothetical protein